MVTNQTRPGQHALESANPDRTKFQRGNKVQMKSVRRRRKKSRK